MADRKKASADLPSISVCFPAYNEEATIGEVLSEADDLLSSSGLDYEILVCNDGSSDGTADRINAVANSIRHLRVLSHPRNLGIRATFEHLYAEASKDFVFLNSTDRQWKTEILFDLLPLTKDWDIIIASRKNKHYGLSRAIVSWAFNLIPRIVFGVETYDAGAVKLVRREVIEGFPSVSRSPFCEAERLIRAARAGYRTIEYPVDIFPRRTGRARGVNWRLLFQSLADVARVWWSLRRQKKFRAPSKTRQGSTFLL